MKAPFYVIREGNVRGQGRYFGYGRDGGRTWFESRRSADPFSGAECCETKREAEYLLQFVAMHRGSNGELIRNARIVRVVAKAKTEKVDRALYQDAVSRLAAAVNERDTARDLALDDAERACVAERDRLRSFSDHHAAFGARSCAVAIAKLRGVR